VTASVRRQKGGPEPARPPSKSAYETHVQTGMLYLLQRHKLADTVFPTLSNGRIGYKMGPTIDGVDTSVSTVSLSLSPRF